VSGKLTFRVEDWRFPRRCVACHARSECTVELYVPGSPALLGPSFRLPEVPTCKRCRWRRRFTGFFAMLAPILLLAFVTSGAIQWLESAPGPVEWAAAVALGLLLLLFVRNDYLLLDHLLLGVRGVRMSHVAVEEGPPESVTNEAGEEVFTRMPRQVPQVTLWFRDDAFRGKVESASQAAASTREVRES
jgi:hypothetical protein